MPATQTFGASLAAWENPRIQIVVRSTAGQAGFPTSANARTVANDAWAALIKVHNQNLPTSTGNHSYYLRIEPVSSPYLADQDSKGRFMFTFHCDVMRTPST